MSDLPHVVVKLEIIATKDQKVLNWRVGSDIWQLPPYQYSEEMA